MLFKRNINTYLKQEIRVVCGEFSPLSTSQQKSDAKIYIQIQIESFSLYVKIADFKIRPYL